MAFPEGKEVELTAVTNVVIDVIDETSADVTGTTPSTARIAQSLGERTVLKSVGRASTLVDHLSVAVTGKFIWEISV